MSTASPQLLPATIASREHRPPGFWCVGIRCPAIARAAGPAQYVAIDLPGPFAVRLPLGIFSAQGDDFTLLFQEWGERTTRLAHLPLGESITCIGPLGNQFTIPKAGSTAVLVAGGLGVAAFWLLARDLKACGVSSTLVLGARTGDRVVGRRDLSAYCGAIEVCTDDGTVGERGTAVDRVRALPRPDIIYGCGPRPMLRALCEHARAEKIACQVSMEETFGCSMGTCWGCVTPVRRGSPQSAGHPRAASERRDHDFARVCADGTVFDAEDLVWL